MGMIGCKWLYLFIQSDSNALTIKQFASNTTADDTHPLKIFQNNYSNDG